jgi:5-methyltetrahydropteroyltriglutamate--homocysteine methyltransferase
MMPPPMKPIPETICAATRDGSSVVCGPEGKILVPGVVTHSTDVVEHPDLVAQRIERFASVVGAENVIAGTDCGFGERTHPQIAWAKLRSLTEGAAQASRALRWGR